MREVDTANGIYDVIIVGAGITAARELSNGEFNVDLPNIYKNIYFK